ncbi:MAG: tRNA (N(6)-L-threonylcarbamoyladenosine(37)-C(2))-methylthiotransferase MtaB [Clostridia bacterium]|jgi:threonylcarbamoyladenosine tRNA methylthiotransferase MtaB|nr:tRNA (N(6)-L-threonylcarbamoyladenosine(37)-C(2))-methylthiotransferase MtaB [Clostridia bacterium]
MSQATRRRAALATLGCKVNQNETAAMAALFAAAGYEVVEFTQEADIYVLNTCTVTHLADRKSRQLIRRCHKLNPDALIAVTGCYAQVAPQEVEKIEGVHLVVGNPGKKRIVELVEEARPGLLPETLPEEDTFAEIASDTLTERARAYLKVQDGCEQYCAYCIIPYARGHLKSRTPDSALNEAGRLIDAGCREIVLTGIHLGLYGRDRGDGLTLEKLLAQLLPLSKDTRWRLSSLEPLELSAGILRQMQEYDNFCPHLHLPLQSGHDEILRAMNRPYTTGDYRQAAEKARAALPDIALTTDLIVGFPGETEQHFAATLEFIEEMAFSRMHIFKYSPRRGTPAATFPHQVPAGVKEERSRQARLLADKIEAQYAKRFHGKILQVLAEQQDHAGIWEGHSENYLQVYFDGNTIAKGEIVRVRLQETAPGLTGIVIQ